MNSLFKQKSFPLIFQAIMLIVFGFLLSLSLGVRPENTEMVTVLRNTNLANLAVWAFWWPLIIIIALIFGRWWCTVCPLELLTSLASMIGLKRKPGKFLKSGWLITILYTIILIVIVETFLVHRIPHRMALYLSGLILLSIISGFIWEKRTFCNYICPVGHLLGLYSMLSFFGLKVKKPATCIECKTKDCFSKDKQYQLTGRSCTSNLNPSKSSFPVKCIYCTQCMTACPHDNLKFGRKNPLERFKGFKLKPAQAAFLLLVSGFMIPELLDSNEKLFAVLSRPAENFINAFNVDGIWTRFIEFSWFILGIPLMILLFSSALNGWINKTSFKETLSALGLYMLPTIAFMHAYKGLTKLISRIPYIPGAFSDPKGIDTANEIIAGNAVVESGIVDFLLDSVHILGPIAAMLSVYLMMDIFRKNAPKGQGITLTIATLYALVFAIGLSIQI